MMKSETLNNARDITPPYTPKEPLLRLSSQELMQHAREIEIDHDGRIYKLRITQLNKLILTA